MASGPKQNNDGKTRQEAREEKLRKKRQKMKQHGKGLGKMYEDAIKKREREKGE
jgi:hypothetical protein